MTPDPQNSLGGSPLEERLGELINEYFDRIERGEKLSKDDFLKEHPDCAAELREHLGGLDLIVDLGTGSGGQTLPGRTPAQMQGSSAADGLEAAGHRVPDIPGYEIHKLIGRGGMGIVYKATQTSMKRPVALKLLMEGPFATEGAKKRFEREIALAAQLKHPHIIPIYDSGNHDGRMYYAMEHIYGLSLIDYIRANPTEINDRLKLFVKICQAVSHAHVRGVIHRDLKPSNILVDGAGDPHILDFGLAKAGTFGDMTTSITAQIVGTPAYMSPEQASGDPGGIDMRTDVYSLGMILYEMLTLDLPYETNVSMGKILQNIAHAEPKHPSKLNPKVDSDLAAIVLKSLEKNKETRYQSVDGLAADVQRYLAGEPIMARPPSGLYLLRKLIVRHKPVVAAAIVFLVIGASVLFMVSQYSAKLAVKEQQNREQAAQKLELEQQLKEKQAAIAAEEKRKEQARQQAEFLKRNMDPQMWKALENFMPDPSAGLNQDALLELLAKGVESSIVRAAPTKPLKSTEQDFSSFMPKSESKKNAPSAEPEPPKVSGRKELEQWQAALELGLKRIKEKQDELAKEEATSQPSATQPVAERPAPASAPTKS
ncbi:MAG TPA: protein kinase [Phycisphaerae bacterium]|nr:protein kinase [Phycisphaerae bacterium]